ncbi:hypothetical protein NLM33_35790 [Bradyrhizobium sp. CCGUVB1N3]|uniref:hypothetical protein n=1 Tax=Bradyrhizobium sp. CCGUVB1N3 TaxID=2949629 RepID=UPI0020B32F31|nr:hypothetical protein [Bradyrhizobium sp. CCGUVB1N3]MCP3475638.1 hypothetical protein [Bradyrhizobium sp. CCGUVB1N3]
MSPVWTDKGLAWIESFDNIDLVRLHATLVELGLEDRLERVIRRRLVEILGSPVPILPKPKPKPKTREKPPNISEKAWAEVVAMQKKPKRKTVCAPNALACFV